MLPGDMTRRELLQLLTAAGVGLASGPIAHGVVYERHRLRRVDHDLYVSSLPTALDGLRVGLITDIHYSSTMPEEDVTRAVSTLQSGKPDVIVLGGDYVTFGDRDYVGPVAELLASLADAPHGSFAILGNHDDDKDMPAALAAKGFTVLKDQRTQVSIKGERLDFAGIRYWTRRVGDVARVLRDTGPTTILLAHDPRRLTEAAELDTQLVLSGHTHGGQVVLPGLGAIAARKFPVIAGVATRASTTLFVSRGVGTVYLPIRINCAPEISVLTLKSKGI